MKTANMKSTALVAILASTTFGLVTNGQCRQHLPFAQVLVIQAAPAVYVSDLEKYFCARSKKARRR